MALATQCPHCQTIFRVAHDQLKLRAGLVRCGACKEIFNGIENLLRSEDVPTAAAPAAVPTVLPTVLQTVLPTVLPPGVPTATPMQAETRWPGLPSTPDPATTANLAQAHPDNYFPAVFFDLPAAYGNMESVEAIDPAVSASSAALLRDSEVADPLDRMTLIHLSDDIDQVDTGRITSTTAAVADPDTVDANGVLTTSSIDSALLDTSSANAISAALSSGSSGSLVQPSADTTADELDQAIDYLQRKPWRGSKKTLSREDVEGLHAVDSDHDGPHHADVPGFVARSRRAQQRRGPLRKLQYAAAALLVTGVAAQSVYLLHDQLAARLPASRPALVSLCGVLGCRIGLPAQIDAVSIESNELITLPSSKNNFSLKLLLRNRSSLPQRWPAIELTLLDGNDRPLVRRVFNPADYLTATAMLTTGFAQNTEQPARIKFESAQQKAANYRVILFYP